MIVGFIAFLIVLRVLSLMLVSPDNSNMKKKGTSMEKTKKKTRIVTSAILESGWAIGVGIIVGQLST
jgi:preprotein translocase subunit YajC